MPYKKIKTLCLSPGIPYKQAKKEIYKIFDEWEDQKLTKQAEAFDELLPALLTIAQQKSRIINYTLDEFLRKLADWGHRIYWQEERWEMEKVESVKKQLIDFVMEMLQAVKRGKTKTSDNLRSYLLRFVTGMLGMELRPELLPILEDSMMVLNTDEQFFALEGMSNYFSWEGTKLSKAQIDKLDEIVATTTVRYNASNALDVLINAGEIGQLSAVIAMDDWKDRNRENW